MFLFLPSDPFADILPFLPEHVNKITYTYTSLTYIPIFVVCTYQYMYIVC